MIINFDGTWVPFCHELNFDNDLWTDACGPDTSTMWAGNMYYGLYNEDNSPAGAPGFQETRNWELVDCDRDGDGNFTIADLKIQPPTYRVTWATCSTTGTYCRLETQDVQTPCTTGKCAYEIVTTFFINLDLDCDGNIDNPLPVAGLCFFAESRTPPPPTGGPFWSGPLQARISTVGGDKTVSFKPQPTVVKLAAFDAAPLGADILVTWETASEFDNLGFNLYRREVGTTDYARLNATLIPSQAPGQGEGAQYAFLDGEVRAGVTYEYLLEDVDMNASRSQHGPVVARAPYAMFLPLVSK